MATFGAGENRADGGKQREAAAATSWPELGGKNPAKEAWPELVGKPAEEAKKAILRDMPGADVVVLPAGTPVTLDYRRDRVRVIVDTVASVPSVG